MVLLFSKDKTIQDVQLQFSSTFPFLRLEFYKPQNITNGIKKPLPHSTVLPAAGFKHENSAILIFDGMTVAQLEKELNEKLGLNAQVIRKSGMIWLETTMTDKWTLKKQNEHGKEISLTPKLFPDTE